MHTHTHHFKITIASIQGWMNFSSAVLLCLFSLCKIPVNSNENSFYRHTISSYTTFLLSLRSLAWFFGSFSTTPSHHNPPVAIFQLKYYIRHIQIMTKFDRFEQKHDAEVNEEEWNAQTPVRCIVGGASFQSWSMLWPFWYLVHFVDLRLRSYLMRWWNVLQMFTFSVMELMMQGRHIGHWHERNR